MSADTAVSMTSPVPLTLRSCYWVVDGRLLAGMHPWSESRSGTLARLDELRAAGIDRVCDLTEADEAGGYADDYPAALAEFGIEHQRFSLPDHDIPESEETMADILDALDGALAAGRKVYLHCHAGIGRTGMVVGCWLARHGTTGDDALERLNGLWQQSRLAAVWSQIPETEAQAQFIRDWAEPAPGTATGAGSGTAPRLERIAGALFGMACAEALSCADAAARRAGHPLAWGGNTAMSLCLADSLMACGGNDADDQMRRYLRWQREALPSARGVAVGIPEEVRQALAQWQWSRKPLAGSHDPSRRDPHSLARATVPALFFAGDPALAIEQAAESSRTTQQSPVVLDACRCVAALVLDALAGVPRDRWLAFDGPAGRQLPRARMKAPLRQIIDGDWCRRAPARPRAATVRGVLRAVLYTLAAGEEFLSGVERVAASSAAPATAAALYGALTGVSLGASALPVAYVRALEQRTLIEDCASRLARASG
jgi:ADP-ribosylglycohydrolase